VPGALAGGVFTAPGVRITGFTAPDVDQVVLGVRPEDLSVLAPKDLGRAALVADVFAFELTGDATLVTIKQGDLMVTAKAGKDFRAALGARVGYAVPADRCHLFDARTEARIAQPVAP
jgi:multiple sugar transport system ATP-binding protein